MINGFQNQYAENVDVNSQSNIKINVKGKKKKKRKEGNVNVINVGNDGNDGNNGKSEQDKSFNIYRLGEVKYAKLNRSATRPLRQLKDPDETVDFCPCCNLPGEKPGYFETFKTCDNPDEFSNCGQGVVLYYTFIKFIIIVMLISSICISIINIYFPYKYTHELKEVCNNYYTNKNEYVGINMQNCDFYTTNGNSIYEDSFFFKFSPTNIKHYRNIYKNTNPENNGDTTINFSRINFGCLIFVFIFNLIFILYIYNKGNFADFFSFTVSDYSIFLYNLYDVHGKFINMLKEINQIKQKCYQTGKTFNAQLHYKRIGFIPDANMPEIDIFKEFLKEKICLGEYGEKFKINKIDLCYKVKDLMKLQEKLEKKKEKIWKVKNAVIIDNRDSGNKKDPESIDNVYEAGCFSCRDEDNGKTVGQINQETEQLQNEIVDIVQKSKLNTLDYFGGSAFITLETIKEQELYLKNLPRNIFEYFFKFLRNLCYMLTSCCDKSKESIYYLKRNIKIESAPEPQDILFENLEISQFQRILRTALVYLVSLIICGISLGIVVGLNKLQTYVDDQKDSNHILLMYIISFIITGAQSVFNIILESVLQTLTEIERQSTMTNYYLSFSLKLTIFYFLNDAILPILSDFFFIDSPGHKILIDNMIMKFGINAFVSPLLWRINISYYLKQIQICLFIKEDKITKSQKELNELYEYPPMNVSLKYSYIFKTLLMTFLYIPIFPLGIVISCLGFIFAYWLEKYYFANI